MLQLDDKIHNCRNCYQIEPSVANYYPVCSFGDLEKKPIWVVGINPNHVEYDGKNGGEPYLLASAKLGERRHSQLDYFSHGRYNSSFFGQVEKFFDGEVKNVVVEWERKPWEKVGFVDLVKCVSKRYTGLITNCESYLKDQLINSQPNLIVAYGAPVCTWFGQYLGWPPKLYEYALVQIPQGRQRSGYCPAISFLHQASPPGKRFSAGEVGHIRRSIIEAFKLLNSPRL